MKTEKEVSPLTGVSLRALHQYEAVGLRKPARFAAWLHNLTSFGTGSARTF